MYRNYLQSRPFNPDSKALQTSSQHRDGSIDLRLNRLNESIEFSQAGDLVTFFNGFQVTNTMNKIRLSIQYIRRNWYEKREEFNAKLKDFLKCELSNHHEKLMADWYGIIDKNIDWCDTTGVMTKYKEHSVIKYYTKADSYKFVFKAIYRILRAQDNASDEEVLTAVYLIELINIDLYNYVRWNPSVSNFEGPVYRGMVVESQHIDQYRSLMNKPINERFISIPLALNSTSKDKNVCIKFIKQQTKQNDDLEALLVVHVIGLPTSMMNQYQKCFPQSQMSTICAVDISAVSAYPNEDEVLLRGAFLQVLNVYDTCWDDIPLVQIECMMLNTNRDHLSNGILNTEVDAAARQLFGSMIKTTRFEYCQNYCHERSITEDEKAYRELYEDAKENLSKILQET